MISIGVVIYLHFSQDVMIWAIIVMANPALGTMAISSEEA